MHNHKNLLAIVLLTLSLANIIIHYLAGHSIQGYLLNSDALYLPTLFSDLLSKNGGINDWFLTPAPYFFPDYPTFLLAYLAGTGAYNQIIIFSLIQALLTFASIWFISKQILHSNPFFTAATISISLIWLALTSAEPFNFLLNSAYHYGIFLIAIVFVGLWIQYKNNDEGQWKAGFYPLMAILAFLSTLSDNLFIVTVIAPLVATTALFSIAERDFSLRTKFPLFLVTTFSILGSISYKLIVTNCTRYPVEIGFNKIFTNLNGIYMFFYSATVNNPIYGVLFLFYIGVVLYSFFQLIKGTAKNTKLSWLAIFSCLSLCTTLVAVLLVTNLSVEPRYLISTLSWPVIIVFIFLNNYLPRSFISTATIISLLAIASLSWGSYLLIKKNGLNTHYYPSEISCIDNVLEREGVTNGIAMYWDAKYLQNFSRLDLNIAQHNGNLEKFLWITSKKYFKQSYDFAIISKKETSSNIMFSEMLMRLNSTPKLVKNCGSSSIYIYGKEKLRVKKIVNMGDSYTWRACELPTIIGEKTAGCEIQKKSAYQSGYITFGPYEQLPTGQYIFEIAYSSTADKIDTVGNWDVVLALPNETKTLKNGLMTGTDGETQKITGEFALDSSQNMKKIEIRTLAKKNMDLKVTYIQISRTRKI